MKSIRVMAAVAGTFLLSSSGAIGFNAAEPSKASLLGPEAQAQMELVRTLVPLLKPVVALQIRDQARRKNAEKLLDMLVFVPNLIDAMDQIKADIPGIPAEARSTYAKMGTSLRDSKAEFAKAVKASHLDEQARSVDLGLEKLGGGLLAPGDFLVRLNQKIFEKLLKLFEALPQVKDMMVIGGRNRQGQPIMLSELMTNMFGNLQKITKDYIAGIKASRAVVMALIAQNEALKAELLQLKRQRAIDSGAGEETLVAIEKEQEASLADDALSLDDEFRLDT